MTKTQISFYPGEDIISAARRLTKAAHASGYATGIFNDVVLEAHSDTSGHDVVMHYHRECSRRKAEYEASPAGQAALMVREEERQRLQSLHDELVAQLDDLDFSYDVDVIDWLSQMQEPSDRIGVAVDRERILAAFRSHGLVPGMDVGPQFNADDRASFYRWLVGQALEGIERISIHGVFHKFAREWREKFAKEAA
jgi:hypothetical protein